MKKKILFRIGSLGGGGAERALVGFVKYLDPNKYDITVLSETKGGVFDSALPPHVKIIFLFKGNSLLSSNPLKKIIYQAYRRLIIDTIRTLPELLYLSKTISVYDVEITWIQDLTPYTTCRFIDLSKGAKKMAWIQTDILRKDYTDKQRKDISSSLMRYDAVIPVSQRTKNSLLQLNPSLDKILWIIPLLADKEHILRKVSEPIAFKKPGKLAIVFLGRLEKVKGIDRLIRSCRKLLDDGLEFVLMIVGDGAERASIEQQIKELSMTNDVLMLGFQSNPYPYLQLADIFVLSSHNEGYPMVVPEAMVLGKPVVATDVSGIKEILNDGEFGNVVENSEEGIYKGLREFVADKGRREAMAQKALAGSARFSAESIINDFEEILKKINA